MNDRELLELAAKAAGVVCVGWAERGDHEWGIADGSSDTMRLWNPLLSDGDALRLAVKLRLDVCLSVCRVGDEDGWYNAEADEIGIEAATRRAIVSAAAEIGRNTAKGDGGGV